MVHVRYALTALASLALALPARASAQSAEPAPRAITLTQAIAYGRANHPAIRAALARVRSREAEAHVPGAQWLPAFGVTAQIFGATANQTTGTYVSPSFMDVPRVGGTRATSSGTWRPYPSTFVGAGGTQELFDFGRIAAQTAAADAAVDVERQRARGDELEVAYDVEEAYFAVFASKQIVKASDDAYARSKAHRDLAKAGVDAGMRSPIELTRAEADLDKFDIGRIRALGGLTAAEGVLAAAVGAQDPALDVADAPPAPAELPSLGLAIQRAEARDPRILAALAELRAREERTRAIGAEMRPDLSLTATISGRAGGAPPSSGEAASADGWVPQVPNWDVGAVLSWPLFDGAVRARERASRALEDEQRAELGLVREEDVAQIRQAYVTVQTAKAALPGLERQVQAALANYAQADARFKAGLGTSVELADAEGVRTQAEIQLALGQFELARARAGFGRVIAEGI